MNLKCCVCDVWSNDVPLKSIVYDYSKYIAFTKCGNCGTISKWRTDAPVFIYVPDEDINNIS